MSVSKAVAAVQRKLAFNKRAIATLMLFGVVGYALLGTALVFSFSSFVALIIAASIIVGGLYFMYVRHLLSFPSSHEASVLLDQKLRAKDRFCTHQYLNVHSDAAVKRELLEKQLETLLPYLDVKAIAPLDLSKGERRFAYSIVPVWIVALCVWFLSDSSLFRPTFHRDEAKLIEKLLEEEKLLPPELKQKLSELADAIEASEAEGVGVDGKLSEAEKELAKAREEQRGEKEKEAEREQSKDQGRDKDDQKAEVQNSKQGKGEKQKEEESKQGESGEGQGEGEGEKGRGKKGEGKEGQSEKGQSEEGTSEGDKEGKDGGGKSAGKEGQGGAQGEGKSEGQQQQGQSGEAKGAKEGALNRAEQTLNQVRQGLQSQSQGADKKEGSGDQTGDQKKQVQGKSKGEGEKEQGKEKGETPSKGENKEPGQNLKPEEKQKQESENSKSGESSGDSKDKSLPTESDKDASLSSKADREAKLQPFEGGKDEGPGLGKKRGFKEAEIKNQDEKFDTRFTGKEGELAKSEEEAKYKTSLSDIKLAKPEAPQEAARQPIPLEYNELLQ